MHDIGGGFLDIVAVRYPTMTAGSGRPVCAGCSVVEVLCPRVEVDAQVSDVDAGWREVLVAESLV